MGQVKPWKNDANNRHTASHTFNRNERLSQPDWQHPYTRSSYPSNNNFQRNSHRQGSPRENNRIQPLQMTPFCKYCRKFGHVVRECCTLYKFCYICGANAHLAMNCPRHRSRRNSLQNKQSNNPQRTRTQSVGGKFDLNSQTLQ